MSLRRTQIESLIGMMNLKEIFEAFVGREVDREELFNVLSSNLSDNTVEKLVTPLALFYMLFPKMTEELKSGQYKMLH